MTLTQLGYVAAVAACGSFSQAARRCHVTQPTLSSGVADLEDELGARLFDRTTRAVRLSRFGAALLPTVTHALQTAESVRVVAEALLHPDKVVLCVGVSPLLDSRLVGLLLGGFRERRPECRPECQPKCQIVLVEDNLTELSQRLTGGSLDVVLVPEVPHLFATERRPARRCAPLYREPLYVVSTALDGVERVRLADVASHQFMLVPDACGLTMRTRQLFRSERLQLEASRASAMSYAVLEEWAELGLGAAILPQSKLGSSSHALLVDKADRAITIGYEAVVAPGRGKAVVSEFLRYAKSVAPTIARGLQLI